MQFCHVQSLEKILPKFSKKFAWRIQILIARPVFKILLELFLWMVTDVFDVIIIFEVIVIFILFLFLEVVFFFQFVFIFDVVLLFSFSSPCV